MTSVRALDTIASTGLVDDDSLLERIWRLRPDDAALAPGEHGAWTCMLCKRTFAEDFKPNHCPDCGARLMRLVGPTDEHLAEWERLRQPAGEAS